MTADASTSSLARPMCGRRTPITDPRDPVQLPPVGFTDPRLIHIGVEDAQRISLTSRPADPHGLWAPARAAAFAAAAKCKLPVLDCATRPRQPGLLITRADVSVVDGVPSLIESKSALAETGGLPKGKRFEEEGGPGLVSIFGFIDRHSSAPLLDIQILVRWVLLSYLFGHTEVHAGQVVLLNRSGNWRLAPFGWMTLFPQVAGGNTYPLARGLRIGGEWPSGNVRVDHWVSMAKAAGIHPKVFISMGRELASTAPTAVLESMCHAMQSTTLRGAAADTVRAVQRRAERFKELALLAPHQGVSGIKKAPVVTPPDHHEPERKSIEVPFE